MKRILNKLTILTMFVVALACTDESLDPFILNDIQKGSLLALRGDDGSAGNLNPDQNFFFKDNISGDETFSYVADFISEDQSLLETIQVYARQGAGGPPRTLVATIPGSSFVSPSAGAPRQGKVEVALSTILSAMGNNMPDTITRTNLLIESDIILTDGTIVPSSAIVNTGLFAASAFFPAHQLNYYAEVQADFQPVATSKMAGEVVKNSAGAVTSRPVFPLKAGSRDTLLVTFPSAVTPPSISYSPSGAVTTVSAITVLPNKKASDVTQTYFQIVEAAADFTTPVTATISGATQDVLGITLTQKVKTQTINVDNGIPLVSSVNTGRRIGKGQVVTIKATFNEKMSAKSANRLKISISGQGQEGVTSQNMDLSSNGLEYTYVYAFKELTPGSATHGPITITFTGGTDEAGNALAAGALDAAAADPAVQLISDIGVPPAPSLSLDADWDVGTQIKWSALQGTTGANLDGAVTGRVYWVAVVANDPPPTGFTIDADENGVWTVGTGTSTQPFSSTIAITSSTGNSGTVFTPFTKDGTFDIYAVFVSTTNNRSAITATPQLEDVVMASIP